MYRRTKIRKIEDSCQPECELEYSTQLFKVSEGKETTTHKKVNPEFFSRPKYSQKGRRTKSFSEK